MARDFDGTNDNLLSADNAATGLDQQFISISTWAMREGVLALQVMIGIITAAAGANRVVFRWGGTTLFEFVHVTSGTSGVWNYNTALNASQAYHFVATFDRGNINNDPVLYVDGASVTVNEATTPTGAFSTGADTIKMGENVAGTNDYDGVLAFAAMQGSATAVWDAAAVNRARWWGRPHGGLTCYFPFLTAKLTDEGSAGATLTATGSIVRAFAIPVVRPCFATMGMKVGW